MDPWTKNTYHPGWRVQGREGGKFRVGIISTPPNWCLVDNKLGELSADANLGNAKPAVTSEKKRKTWNTQAPVQPDRKMQLEQRWPELRKKFRVKNIGPDLQKERKSPNKMNPLSKSPRQRGVHRRKVAIGIPGRVIGSFCLKCNPPPVRGKNFPLYGPLCGADLFW